MCATGIRATGIRAIGIHAIGIRAIGIRATGIRAIGIHAIGIRAIGIRDQIKLVKIAESNPLGTNSLLSVTPLLYIQQTVICLQQ